MKHLQTIVNSNPPSHFIIALCITTIAFLMLFGIRYIALNYIQKITIKTKNYWNDILMRSIGSIHILVLFLFSLLLGLLMLDMSKEMYRFFLHAAIILFLYQFTLSTSQGISRWIAHRIDSQQDPNTEQDENNYFIIHFILQVVLWSIAFFLILDNLGINVTALVTSLGIGGIAIALAVQSILGDLFASLSISLDKPFVVGDFIVIDDQAGIVKKIGLKTTRITSSTGEELIFSNTDLLKIRIHNYKKMEMRRIVYTLGVTFDTSNEMLKRIPDIVRDIFKDIKIAELHRVYFRDIGEFSLNFRIVYYIHIGDYNAYVQAQQALNLAIMERFNTEKINFAFPTQTIYINQSE